MGIRPRLSRPNLLRADPMPNSFLDAPRAPDIPESPLFLLAVLVSARRSKDRALERLTRRRLENIGIRISFGDELAIQPTVKKTATGGKDA